MNIKLLWYRLLFRVYKVFNKELPLWLSIKICELIMGHYKESEYDKNRVKYTLIKLYRKLDDK